MLYNKSTGKTKFIADVFSLESLIAWLEHQPAKAAYCYESNGHCLLAKYFTAMGLEKVMVGSCTVDYGRNINKDLPDHFNEISWEFPRTFGAALERARGLL